MSSKRPVSRAALPFMLSFPTLGPLRELPGTWTGRGFNLIARPDFQNGQPFFLELNGTIENLQFTEIGGDIPNRGSTQKDIELRGIHYLQQVADCETLGALHIEPGIWLHVVDTADPAKPVSTIVRQATIPHGDSLLAQSTFVADDARGGPTIKPVFSVPFTDAATPGLNATATKPLTDPKYLAQYLNPSLPPSCLPAGLDLKAVVKDPTQVLTAAIQGQTIEKTVVIQVSTVAAAGSSGILNIPFVVKNANATQMDAIFWIETVHPQNEEPFLQLQYVQRVILNFIGIHWPHISVATLIKQ